MKTNVGTTQPTKSARCSGVPKCLRKTADTPAGKKSVHGKNVPKINGTYDYLLNIKTVQYTEECVRELLKESKQAREGLEIMKKTSHIDMWKMDIKNM